MYSKDTFPLEGFLQQEIALIPRNHTLIHEYSPTLPTAWQQALSSPSPVEDVVADLWQPILERARGFVFRLANITQDLALVVSPSHHFKPYLLYIYAKNGRLSSWLAGYPADEDVLNAQENRLGVRIPSTYRRFSEIHNGFVWNGNGAVGFVPLEKLNFLSERGGLLEQFALQETGHDRKSLLAFWGDGSGNYQCYDLKEPAGKLEAGTVFWDHEVAEALHPQSFWSFLKDFTIRHIRW